MHFQLIMALRVKKLRISFLSKYVRLNSLHDDTFMYVVSRLFLELQAECTISS